ncbi:hypothetical protein SDC9_155541 [bioreactor metagenome]|uniref:Uncharacterized protein n=1 Tax=bioreactor metagenome TaxID=1076179 RepID=A0A645F499_9ZZZZ
MVFLSGINGFHCLVRVIGHQWVTVKDEGDQRFLIFPVQVPLTQVHLAYKIHLGFAEGCADGGSLR